MRFQLWEADKREENSSKMGSEARMLHLYLSPRFSCSSWGCSGHWLRNENEMSLYTGWNGRVCWGLEVSTDFSRIAGCFIRDTLCSWAIWKRVWHSVSCGPSCPCKITLFLNIQYLALCSIGGIYKDTFEAGKHALFELPWIEGILLVLMLQLNFWKWNLPSSLRQARCFLEGRRVCL